jgi:hypothetical protein
MFLDPDFWKNPPADFDDEPGLQYDFYRRTKALNPITTVF